MRLGVGYVRRSDGKWARAIVGWRWSIYIDPADRWIGWYKSEARSFFCPLPCIVFRRNRLRRAP